jgi:hypothetical protein
VNDETTVIAAVKPKRVSSETTKNGWVIRCMAAENTVKAQDIELRQERGRAITLHAQLQDAEEQAAKLRARAGKLTSAASVLAVIATVLVFALAGLLIGGAR